MFVTATAAVLGMAGLASAQIHISENFDGLTTPNLPVGWSSSTTGTGADPWVSTSAFFSSGPNSAAGTYDSNLTSTFLELPSFVANNDVEVSFMRRNVMELNFDGATLEMSRNGGPFANVGAGVWSTGGYTGTISTFFSSAIGGQMAWANTQTTFIQTTGLLDVDNGDTVALRFRVTTDSSVIPAGAGLWIDNLVIQSIPAPGAMALLGLAGLVGARRRSRA
jgi:hypothetical protein